MSSVVTLRVHERARAALEAAACSAVERSSMRNHQAEAEAARNERRLLQMIDPDELLTQVASIKVGTKTC